MLLYSLLHLTGYDLPLDDLKAFRQWDSRTPGHPEFHLTPGVEATTGPLGQGTANAVGMAIAERFLAARFNRPGHDDRRSPHVRLVSDGDLMEGISHEAASLAGHLKLGKLIYLYDDNHITLDGPTSLAFTRGRRARATRRTAGTCCASRTATPTSTRSIGAIRSRGRRHERPSIIVVRTTIGYGSPNKAGTVGGARLAARRRRGGADQEGARAGDRRAAFYVPGRRCAHCATAGERGREGAGRVAASASRPGAQADPELAAEWRRRAKGELPAGLGRGPAELEAGRQPLATRVGRRQGDERHRRSTSRGCSAATPTSRRPTKTRSRTAGDFDGQTGAGRNIHFGVREHAMGAIGNGMAYHGGVRPFAATFFCFSDYMRPAVRLAAL